MHETTYPFAFLGEESTLDEGLIPAEFSAKIVVGNPEKHGEGFKDAFVTYECRTEYPEGCAAGEGKCRVRRRYQDFLWLLGKMAEEEANLGIILPPLPDKNQLNFMDRFSPDFIRKRLIGLERFLNRLARHPRLQCNPNLKLFLTRPGLGVDHSAKTAAATKVPNIEGPSGVAAVVEQLADVVGNVFSRGRPVGERFLVMKKVVTVTEGHFERLSQHYSQLHNVNKTLSQEMLSSSSALEKLSSSFGQLERLVASNFNPNTDLPACVIAAQYKPALRTLFGDYGQLLEEQSTLLMNFSTQVELKMHIPMVELSNYCKSAKHTLRLRDKKHNEWLDLSDELRRIEEELQVMSGEGAASAGEGSTEGGGANNYPIEDIQVESTTSTQPAFERIRKSSANVMNYFSEKIDSFRGVDPITSRSDRVKRLEQRLRDLQVTLTKNKEQSELMDTTLERDFSIFTDLLVEEMRSLFSPDVCKTWSEFHRQELDLWQNFMHDTLRVNIGENQ